MVMQIGGEDVVATPEALTELMGRKRKVGARAARRRGGAPLVDVARLRETTRARVRDAVV